VSDIDTAAADSLKVLDPKQPIREADMCSAIVHVRFVPEAEVGNLADRGRLRFGTLIRRTSGGYR
jgi:hypothetical protein